MITTYPFAMNDEIRQEIVDTVQKCMKSGEPKVAIAAAACGAKLVSVNLGVFKQLASDQVQRHLSFDKEQTIEKAQKQKVLNSMSDEELEILEKMAERLGGVIDVEGT